MIGLRYLEPRQFRNHGHVLIAWFGKRIVTLEIDQDGEVIFLYSNRNPGGKIKVWQLN